MSSADRAARDGRAAFRWAQFRTTYQTTFSECELPDYIPGQHIEIEAAIDGDVVRAYSLTGAARVSKRKQYSIAVRHQQGRGPDGKIFEGKMSCFIGERATNR